MSGPVFADTFFWVALISRRDSARSQAKALQKSLEGRPIVTTEEVLTETLNFFSSHDPDAKERALRSVSATLRNPSVRVITQSSQSFRAGLRLYKARPDKGYSLTDCISMNTMRAEGIDDILTNDVPFTQEGFRALLRA